MHATRSKRGCQRMVRSNKWLCLFDGPTTAMICFSRDDIWMDLLNEWPRLATKKRRDYFNGNVKWQRVTDTVKDLNALPEL